MKAVLLVISHAVVGVLGFAAGVYFLPILVAPPAPGEAALTDMAAAAELTGAFRRDLAGSDALHWGEGQVSVTRQAVALQGRLAPGPDYKLYLSPAFVETEEAFLRLKPRMLRVGDVKTFENFVVPLPPGTDPTGFGAVIVWCEAFGQFITAAELRPR
jgi:hypothetical protein